VTGLAAYLACTIAFAALACGHHGQDWPLLGAWRWLWAALRGLCGFRPVRDAPRPADGRLWLRSAPVLPAGSPATGPARPTVPRWSAPQAPGDPFPAPTRPSASQARTAPSWARTDKEAA